MSRAEAVVPQLLTLPLSGIKFSLQKNFKMPVGSLLPRPLNLPLCLTRRLTFDRENRSNRLGGAFCRGTPRKKGKNWEHISDWTTVNAPFFQTNYLQESEMRFVLPDHIVSLWRRSKRPILDSLTVFRSEIFLCWGRAIDSLIFSDLDF